MKEDSDLVCRGRYYGWWFDRAGL